LEPASAPLPLHCSQATRVGTQITAAVRSALAAPAAAHELTEHLVENVGKAAGGEAEIARAAPPALFEGGMTKPIIGGALLIIL